MKITRVYADTNGESHFEDLDITLRDGGAIGSLSDAYPVHDLIFRENAPDYDYDWHNAPQRQLIVLLDGAIELEVSDGEKRTFEGGDLLLVEDVHGTGHRTRTIDGQARRSLFITLPENSEQWPPDVVQEAGEDSFPASDAPSWTGTTI